MFGGERLDNTAHVRRPWRIHEFTEDFRVLDVWALPTPGGRDDFGELVELWRTFDPGRNSPIVRALFTIRWSIGKMFGLDTPEAGLGGRVQALRDRLTADLRDTATQLATSDAHFQPVYITDEEFAMEIANHTVHGVLHVGWVADVHGTHRGQMAVLVRPNGVMGRMYLVAIAPFRHLIVYPLMLRDIGRLWQGRSSATRQPESRPR
ncbi:hypothetical protein A5765_00960 [Mycolicibacterium celeriflavum]|uniref:Uncharacterized protein n=1 Tax=Mycolicibacterium celeriflavum TaxID=1249101 RepID=A0A1X0BU99_MYCCF|nr:DUF2867 domain-containing protein [Mycolicibacterium celeriflavum]MCV7240862.1 DUF2867 domain-containing protein [Mycolicibacterium celeriflavum]OBG13144.1 hypothetical protein A5765_00960 [Mycolicibacterium celeriflavum]ORA47524.1 hypothetical protein BST21_12480 [Mycolicibacterium celeriflavum]BBY42432.1 hypothetical protein MCEL_07270 [Mycolicibacterium celeriflavum]